ncbi:MAG: hypothetical protein ACREEB_16580 [Caulobacteraceae bacterium]
MLAVGFRPHTYWTAAVALAGPPTSPFVTARARIDFAAGDERNVYHRVAEMDAAAAETWVTRVRAGVLDKASRGIERFVTGLGGPDAVVAAVVPSGRGNAPTRIADIVKSHTMMHAAEGEFYRQVVADACAPLGVAVRRIVERDLAAETARRLGIDEAALEARLKEMGRALGPPWSEDQKLATLAAWVGLMDEPTSPKPRR